MAHILEQYQQMTGQRTQYTVSRAVEVALQEADLATRSRGLWSTIINLFQG